MEEVFKLAFDTVCEDNKLDPEQRIKIIKECINAGIDINSNGTSILENAIKNKDNETINFLFENGIDGNWDRPLSVAYYANNMEVVERLLKLGANPNSMIPRTINIDIVKLFIEYGANVDKLFTELCINDIFLHVVEYLISIGANYMDNELIVRACQLTSNQKIKRLLLENGADPNATSNTYINRDICLLELAMIYADLEGCKLLLEFGADVNRCYNIINKKYDYVKDSIYDEETELRLKPIIDLYMEYDLDITEFVHRMDIVID